MTDGEAATGNANISNTGTVAIFIGFLFHLVTTVYCMRASCQHHHRSARTFHYISLIVTGAAALAYLLMGLGALAQEDTYYLHFAEWVCTTPLLLVDLGLLARMQRPEIYFIAVADVLMIGAGYYAEIQTSPWRIWPVVCFSVVMFLVILQSLITHIYDVKAHPETNPAESKAFVFLSTYTIALWTGYSVLWTIIKVGIIPVDTAAILYTLMDIAAKDVFGLVIFGVRDVLSGDSTPLGTFAMAMTGINPTMRRHSIDEGIAQVMAVLSAMEAGANSSTDPVMLRKLVTAAKNGDHAHGARVYHTGAAPTSSRNGSVGSLEDAETVDTTGDASDTTRRPNQSLSTSRSHPPHKPQPSHDTFHDNTNPTRVVHSARGNGGNTRSNKVSFRERQSENVASVPPIMLQPAGRRISTSHLMATPGIHRSGHGGITQQQNHQPHGQSNAHNPSTSVHQQHLPQLPHHQQQQQQQQHTMHNGSVVSHDREEDQATSIDDTDIGTEGRYYSDDAPHNTTNALESSSRYGL